MFGRQRERLRRCEWAGPNGAQMLSEELYAMMDPEQELTHEGPLTLIKRGDDPYIIFRGGQDGETAMAFKSRAGNGLANVSTQDGNLTGDANAAPVAATGKSTTSAMPGKVISGTGATYQVRVYPSGLAGASQVVSVTQLQIDSAATIPADTWALVTKVNGSFVMQVPCWL